MKGNGWTKYYLSLRGNGARLDAEDAAFGDDEVDSLEHAIEVNSLEHAIEDLGQESVNELQKVLGAVNRQMMSVHELVKHGIQSQLTGYYLPILLAALGNKMGEVQVLLQAASKTMQEKNRSGKHQQRMEVDSVAFRRNRPTLSLPAVRSRPLQELCRRP